MGKTKFSVMDITAPDYRTKVFDQLQRMPFLTQINELADGSKFVPISMVEDCLNLLFPFSWSHEITNFHVVVNEIVMTSVLKIDVPNQFTFTRAGAASCMIPLKKGSAAVDVSGKYLNGLEKSFPKGKAECLKNASRSLGPLFGANLNRKIQAMDETGRLLKIAYESPVFQDVKKYSNWIETAKTTEDKATLGSIWNQLPESLKIDSEVMDIFEMAKNRVNQKSIS